MSEQEMRDFLAQFDKAREDFKTWPEWMQQAAVERVAAFPRAASPMGSADTDAPKCEACNGTGLDPACREETCLVCGGSGSAASPLQSPEGVEGRTVGVALGDGAEQRIEAFTAKRLAEIRGCTLGCGAVGQCKAAAHGNPSECPARGVPATDRALRDLAQYEDAERVALQARLGLPRDAAGVPGTDELKQWLADPENYSPRGLLGTPNDQQEERDA